jgi:1,4-alpha-glucan branching enzyme
VAVDPNLVAHEEHLRYRWNQYRSTRASIEKNEGSLANFAKSYEHYGIVHENVSIEVCGSGVSGSRLVG